MNKINLSKLAKNLQASIRKHHPEILTGIGIAGMITTTIMAVKATPKALDRIAEIKEIHKDDADKKAFSKDFITKVAPVYIPATIIGCTSIACLIGASSVNLKRNAALATAYTLSESALKEYQEKVVETIGEKKEKTIKSAIAKDKIDKNPVDNCEVIITDKGNTLCYDAISGRYFKSDIEKIKRAVNELNRRMLVENYISLNEFYDEIGLKYTKIGDNLGWNIDKGLIDVDFSAQLNGNGDPCLVLDYQIIPNYNYNI